MQMDLDAKMQVRLLYGCVDDGDLPEMKRLLAMGFALSHPEVRKNPLEAALLRRSAEMVDLLLDAGAQLPDAPKERDTAVKAGLSIGNLKIFEMAREQHCLPNTIDDEFVNAAKYKHEALALRLLELGADPTTLEGYSLGVKRTGFELATRWCSPQLTSVMVDRIHEDDMNDLLATVVRHDQPRAVRALLAAGADAHQTVKGRSLLQIAPAEAEEVKRLIRSAQTGSVIDAAMSYDEPASPTTAPKAGFTL